MIKMFTCQVIKLLECILIESNCYAVCVFRSEEEAIWCVSCQRNAPLATKALAMNIKAQGQSVPKLLCGPNQTHLSVLGLQAVAEMSHEVSYNSCV